MIKKYTSKEIKDRLSNLGEAIGNIALEYIIELEEEIDKMKSCPICKYRKKSLLDEPCKHCSRCAFSNNALDQENVSDKYEYGD